MHLSQILKKKGFTKRDINFINSITCLQRKLKIDKHSNKYYGITIK